MPFDLSAAETVGVCGAGYSGQALTRALRRLGKTVLVTDDRPAEQLTDAEAVLSELGATLYCGAHDADFLAPCDLLIVSPGVAYATPSLVQLRSQGTPVWGEVELAARLTKAKLVGVTGTKGKTTTCVLTSRMLDAPLANAEAFAARGVPLIDLVSDNPTMPLAVVELTSYQLESIDQLRPWVATLLNVAEDHTDRHPTHPEYVAAKARIFENQQPDDRSIYNLDDFDSRTVGERLDTVKVAVSEHQEPEFGVWATADGLQVRLPASVGGLDRRLATWDEISPALRVQRPSMLAACATALMAGAELEAVRSQLTEFEGLQHRMEFVREWHGLTFINDSKATNPLATTNAIVQSPAPVVLLAGGQTKGIDLTPLVEPFRGLRGLVVYGEDAQLLADRASQAGVAELRRASSLEDAVTQGIELGQDGDWVILSPCGASFDMFRNFAERGECFKRIVQSLAE